MPSIHLNASAAGQLAESRFAKPKGEFMFLEALPPASESRYRPPAGLAAVCRKSMRRRA